MNSRQPSFPGSLVPLHCFDITRYIFFLTMAEHVGFESFQCGNEFNIALFNSGYTNWPKKKKVGIQIWDHYHAKGIRSTNWVPTGSWILSFLWILSQSINLYSNSNRWLWLLLFIPRRQTVLVVDSSCTFTVPAG